MWCNYFLSRCLSDVVGGSIFISSFLQTQQALSTNPFTILYLTHNATHNLAKNTAHIRVLYITGHSTAP